MSRAPSTFRQLDVTRAVKAIRAAGYEVGRILIDATGKIEIVTASGAPPTTPDDLDRELEEFQARNG